MYGDHSWGSSQLHYASYFVWFSYQGVDSGVVGVTFVAWVRLSSCIRRIIRRLGY